MKLFLIFTFFLFLNGNLFALDLNVETDNSKEYLCSKNKKIVFIDYLVSPKAKKIINTKYVKYLHSEVYSLFLNTFNIVLKERTIFYDNFSENSEKNLIKYMQQNGHKGSVVVRFVVDRVPGTGLAGLNWILMKNIGGFAIIDVLDPPISTLIPDYNKWILAHEIAHGLGLKHNSNRTPDIMTAPYYTSHPFKIIFNCNEK